MVSITNWLQKLVPRYHKQYFVHAHYNTWFYHAWHHECLLVINCNNNCDSRSSSSSTRQCSWDQEMRDSRQNEYWRGRRSNRRTSTRTKWKPKEVQNTPQCSVELFWNNIFKQYFQISKGMNNILKWIHYTIQHLQTKHVNEWKIYEEEP